MRGNNSTTGAALIEDYDLGPTSNSTFGSVSTRDLVQTGDNVMISGFIVGGGLKTNAPDSVRVLVRRIGPSLTQFGIADALQDPVLEIHDSHGAIIAQNDNWRDTQQTLIQRRGIPPTDDRESAILQALPPGNYTPFSMERTAQAVGLSSKSTTGRNEPETSSRPGTLAENVALIANDFES